MNPYLEKLLSELPQQEDGSLLDMLYFSYQELHPQDSPPDAGAVFATK